MNRRLPRGVARRQRSGSSTGAKRLNSGVLSRCFAENKPERSVTSARKGNKRLFSRFFRKLLQPMPLRLIAHAACNQQ